METYAKKHGYHFYFDRESKVAMKQAYWHKMQLIRKYFDLGYEWVLYTDIDVLFIDHARKIQNFMVNRDIITASECSRKRNQPDNEAPRSGFILLRNSPTTLDFLKTWEESYRFYHKVGNPEQNSFEDMRKDDSWAQHIHLHDSGAFHSYDTCEYALNSFSIHIPGKWKVSRAAMQWMTLSVLPDEKFAWARNPNLVDSAAEILRANLTQYLDNFDGAITKKERAVEVERCLQSTYDAGYKRVGLQYSAAFDKYVSQYLISSYVTNIPTVIHFIVKDKESIPETIAINIATWKVLNPRHKIIVHDDADIEFLVSKLYPEVYSIWYQLLGVQKADIYRYLVTAALGGIYVDSDTSCKLPIDQWGYQYDDSLVLGVEAQNFKVHI